jgi:hypothetical protein
MICKGCVGNSVHYVTNYTLSSSIYFFSCFNGAVSNTDNVVSDEWMIMNNELERMWKEGVIAYSKVLSQHFLEWPRMNTRNLIWSNWCPGRNSNRAPPKYRTEALLPESTCSTFSGLVILWFSCAYENLVSKFISSSSDITQTSMLWKVYYFPMKFTYLVVSILDHIAPND